MGGSPTRRAIKRSMLLPCMRQRAVIALQETRGNYADIQNFVDASTHPYLSYHSALVNDGVPSETAGGVAFL
eukprot:490774-Pyramimonas_sp.AAC.1